jgi:CheY-like chemotaxis protein
MNATAAIAENAAFDADATLEAPRSASPAGVWVPVERLLVEACRRRAAALVGVEVSIDCEAPGLRALDDDLGKLTRSVDLLFEAALGRSKPAELHVAARAAGSEDSPLLVVSIRSRAWPSEADAPDTGAEDLELASRFAERTGGTMLLSQSTLGERRLTVGLEVRWLVACPGRPSRPEALTQRVVVADDNAPNRRIARRQLERLGFQVYEAPGPLALLAHLDPDETCGIAPDWVLLDEDWLRRGDDGEGLRAAIEAIVPPERLVILGGCGAAAPLAAAGLARITKPFDPTALQEILESPAAWSVRKPAGDSPYSFNRW